MMIAFEWFLFFSCIWLKVINTEGSSWTAQLPSSVKGLPGSCVVIPCSFNYPDSKKAILEFRGIWRDQGYRNIFHTTKSLISQSYQSRGTLVGNLKQKNCSLKIDPLHERDTGPFNFRIELENYDNYNYKNKVSISMIREPDPITLSVKDELKVGQNFSASCFVSHSCPASPPRFNWSHNGEQHFQSEYIKDGQWTTTSILRFRPTQADHNKALQCSVTHKGGQTQHVSKTLKVQHAPVNVKVEYKSDVREGETVKLTCMGDAHPPVHSYEWHTDNDEKHCQGNLCILPNISRHIGPMYCIAINEEGRAKSNLVQLNVLYVPVIKMESSCVLENYFIQCECLVDSQPSSEVHFLLADKVLPGAKGTKGSYSIRTLVKDLQSSRFVKCVANNTQGTANLTLHILPNEIMPIVLTASGASVCVLILIITAGTIIKCRRKRGNAQVPDMNTKMTERCVESPHYDTANRGTMSDDYSFSGIYADCDNSEGDYEEAIYANV